jgi:hypothetical protein
MTFKNLNFVPHKGDPKGGIQASLKLGNGKILSVVAGEGLYSTSRDGVKKPVVDVNHVSSFEVAIIDEVNPNFEVLGWQSREDINRIIQENE